MHAAQKSTFITPDSLKRMLYTKFKFCEKISSYVLKSYNVKMNNASKKNCSFIWLAKIEEETTVNLN